MPDQVNGLLGEWLICFTCHVQLPLLRLAGTALPRSDISSTPLTPAPSVQPLEAPAPSHAAPRVSAAASKCLAAFWKVLVAAVLLAFALYYCRYELAWLFVDGPQLLPSAWHGLLAQQLLPCLNKYYAGVWGMPPQEAAAAAAEAAAVQAKNISFKKAVLAVLLILGALFVFFFKAMGGFRAALNELAASKRSG